MSLNLSVPPQHAELRPRITVIGVGGAGGNAVNNMIRSKLEGVEFVVANTDAQALTQNIAETRLQLGVGVTQGLGAGSRPDIGRAAAEEALDQVLEVLDGAHMVFIAAGMGGGTGTGAAPVIARAARDQGILTVGVVTKPFNFEGQHRMRLAEAGLAELQSVVDTLIIIPNQNLFRVANEKTTFADAFKMADDVLYSGVRGVTDLMIMPGLINLDFADIRSVMGEMGKAMMGTGEAEGDERALEAANKAISNPLLDDVSMKGARGVLINITGGLDMTLFEVDEAANRIREEVDPEANIIFGSTFDEALNGRMRVSVVATGIDAQRKQAPAPTVISMAGERQQRAQHAAQRAPAAAATAAAAPAVAAIAHPQPEPAVASRVEPTFIPPRPVEPELAPATAAPMPAMAEVFAEAAIVNAGARQTAAPPAPTKRAGIKSILNRMITARPAVAAPTQAPPAVRQEPRVRPQPPTARQPVQAPQPPQPQPKLAGLEPERATAQASEDLLDIPAFLRRQAN